MPVAPADAIGWLQRLSPVAEWNGQLILLSHIKVQEWMAYFRPCCKRDVQTESEILLPLILLRRRYESSILFYFLFFVFVFVFFFCKKAKSASYDHILPTTIHTYECKEW